jgi:hypothetical protein
MKFRRGVFRRASSYAPFVCMSCLAGGTTASAQAVNHRVWVGVGASFTNVAFHCADCRSVRFGFDDRLSGIGVNVGIGWVATKQFRVGVEASAWATHDHGTGNDIGSILAGGSIRPVYALPLRVRAGFGGMRYWEGNTSIHRGRSTAFAAEAGLETDLRLARRWLVTPFFTYTATVAPHMTVNGSVVSGGVRPGLLRVGVDVIHL